MRIQTNKAGGGSRSMREQAAILGGVLEVESGRGRGITVRLRIPLPQGTQE